MAKSNGDEAKKTEKIFFERPEVSYVSKCSKFEFDNVQDYERQFNELYHSRLDALRPRIIEAAAKKFGPEKPIRILTDLYDKKDECIVIGTIYKIQELKPSVLKEIADEASVLPQPVQALKLTSSDDKCILEDENLRVNLTGGYIDHGSLVTGVTLGVLGYQEEGGSFEVIRTCFAEPPLPPCSIATSQDHEDCYVLMFSGLNFHGEKDGDADDARRILYCRLLSDWITGKIGDEEELEKIRRIVRVVIAGGNVSDKSHIDGRELGQIARFRSRKTAPPTVAAVKALDDFLSDIVASVDVDLMPGEHDPTNHMLPQQPLHRCMFPLSADVASLHQCTNPYAAEINGVSFLGTSGQNIDDILKYSTLEDSLAVLQSTLDWCHLCPTAPDTLGCYPYYQKDPFLLEGELPHVYFAGNQSSFQSKLIEHGRDNCENDETNTGASKKTLLLALPKFSETGFCALVNLRTLEVEPIIFEADELFNGQHDGDGLSELSMEVEDESPTPSNSVGGGTPLTTGDSTAMNTPDMFDE